MMLKLYFQFRLIPLFLLGISSGLPWALIHSTLSLWMKDLQIDLKTIGLFSLVALPYSLKPLWAPFLDIAPFKPLSHLGKRMSWIVFSQMAIFLSLSLMSIADPKSKIIFFSMSILVAFFSANQDIAIDAWRISFLKEDEQGIGIAASVNGFHVGKLLSSAGTIVLAELIGWHLAYLCMAFLMCIGIWASISLAKNPAFQEEIELNQLQVFSFKSHLYTLIDALKSLFQQNHIYWIFAFILFFKLGDALLDVMLLIFLSDIGFQKLELAWVIKTWGTIANVTGVVIGGLLIHRIGIFQALVYSGILQVLSNLSFSWQAWMGHQLWSLYISISIEKLSGGLATTAFVAYLSILCKAQFAAIQYALLSSLSSAIRTIIQSLSGWMSMFLLALGASYYQNQNLPPQTFQFLSKAFGWSAYFAMTAICAIPGMCLLWVIHQKTKKSIQ
jgi:PAT family beta-lactamase induction signal transducer AmpG